MHYITLANYGITGSASVAMPILPSALLKSICSRQATPLAINTANTTTERKNNKKSSRKSTALVGLPGFERL